MIFKSPHPVAGILVATFAALSSTVYAEDCAILDDDAQRLACYDKNSGRKLNQKINEPASSVTAIPQAKPAPEVIEKEIAAKSAGVIVDRRAETDSKRLRTLTDAWDLDPANGRPPFELRSYKPMYLLASTYTSNTNRQPSSAREDASITSPIDLKSTEAQFQISFKTKIWDNIFKDNGSVWVGYTQSSRWQIYNSKLSRPFRETDYEPEAVFVLRTPYEIAGWQGRMTSLAVTHQSNGRALPLSRSWNRVIAQFGLEKDDWLLLVRPWWRISEKRADDDNPGIENYVGRGELIIAKRYGGQTYSLQARHSLRGGENSRGSVKLEWSLPLSGYLKAHLSLFSGYGESLIDFNHRQTLIGAGISLVEWQ
jgi:phospholipase A1/A2